MPAKMKNKKGENEVNYTQCENDSSTTNNIPIFSSSSVDQATPRLYHRQIIWQNVVINVILHGLALYAITYLHLIKWQTFYFTIVLSYLSFIGIQAGAHRLWSHQSYKANFSLRLFLSLCHVLALQDDLYNWVRDHRCHHKWIQTDADPHNSNRGFFFSHVGWLFVKKHPEVLRLGKTLDLKDIESDYIVKLQQKYYIQLVLLIGIILPVCIPVYIWGECAWFAFLYPVVFRYVYNLNTSLVVNFWAHINGYPPYIKKIVPVGLTIHSFMMGEGFLNYHHVFPWDYSISELGPFDVFNPAALIEFFNFMGWAWDLQQADRVVI